VLARFPVTVKPSPIGSRVSLDAGFNVLTFGEDVGVPYDMGRGEWIPSSQPGEWLIGFAPPRAVGKLKVERATLMARFQQLSVQTMTIRRGQVRNGQPRRDSNGPVVAQYARTNAASQPPVTFDASDADADAYGRVWLLVQLETPPPTGGTVPPWQVSELGVSIEATVTGAPLPPPPPMRSAGGPEKDDDEDE
jgi:hypothetical protein